MKRGRDYDKKGLAKKKRKTAPYNRTGGYAGRFTGANAELKFHDVDHDDAAIATGGTVIPSVVLIAQGVTESTRIGRKCVVKKIGWKYEIFRNASTNPADNDQVRVILFQDKQCNGATAAVLDILETADYQSFRNLANTQRFNILHDKSYDMNAMAGGGDGTTIDQFAFSHHHDFYKVCTIPMEFDGTDGTLGTITSNNIGTLLISEFGNSGMRSKFRIRFSDSG